MAVFLPRAWRHQPQYPVNAGPEWRVAFNAATSPQSTDSTGVMWALQATTGDWLSRARVALPPHGIAFQAEQFYGGDDSISALHSGGADYLLPRLQGTMVVLGKVVTPVAYQPAVAVSQGALLRGDIDETWFQLGGNIWTTGQAWSVAMDGLSALALTWGDFGRRLYKNGQLLASTSTAPGASAHSGTLNIGGDGMRYWMCAISGDVLDAGALSENPWQVFRPRTARIYSFPSAGGPQSYSYTGTGGLTFAGAAPAARATVRPVAGGLVFSGAGLQLKKAEPAPAGGAVFGGAATYSSSSGGTQSFDYVASGGLTFSGAVVRANGRLVNSVGGFTTSGAAEMESRRAVEPISGMVFGGTADYVRIGGYVATRIYGIDLGASEETVTEGVGSATTKGMELTIDMDKFTSKAAVLTALTSLQNYIAEDNWPPT